MAILGYVFVLFLRCKVKLATTSFLYVLTLIFSQGYEKIASSFCGGMLCLTFWSVNLKIYIYIQYGVGGCGIAKMKNWHQMYDRIL